MPRRTSVGVVRKSGLQRFQHRRKRFDQLAPLRNAEVDTLILGCTHYPLLSDLIAEVMGPGVVLVSSAEETAKDVYSALSDLSLGTGEDAIPGHEFLCTGDPAQFQRVAEVFLGPEVSEVSVAEVRV